MSSLAVHFMLLILTVVAASCHRSDVEKDVSSQQVDSAVTPAATDDDSCASATAGVPRKHKKIHRSAAATAAAATASNDSSLTTEGQVPLAPVHPYRKPANPYVAYRNIKMKVSGWYFFLSKMVHCLNNERDLLQVAVSPVDKVQRKRKVLVM